MSEKTKTDRLGVSRLEFYFSENGWLFREQSLHDHGIDAQVEIVEDGRPTGELIAIQIKSGSSYFSEQTKSDVVYRADDAHIQYWSRHALPVIIVLYDPEADALLWERVTDETIINTGKGWKINVPKSQVLVAESLAAIKSLTQPPPYIRRLNKLRLDKRWIDLIANGEIVYIEYEDWINKSLPRFQFTIGCDSREDIENESWPMTYMPWVSMEDAIAHVVPWASVDMDMEAHAEYMETVWAEECYSWHDKETDTTYYSETFEEWYRASEGIVPVDANGETETYRLVLSLNEIGNAFVELDEYLLAEDYVEERAFTLEE